jgi:hypothetical protein
MPFFTVGIPTFNRARFLPETLTCLMQQTYQDFEIVVSDNASTDNTAEVVERFQDGRIRYVRQPAFIPAVENWYACGELAHADWLVFNQDDDLLCPFFLERCAKAISRSPEIVMYAAESTLARDVRHHGVAFGTFPLRHRWDEPQPRLLCGSQIAVLTWFMTGFFPPAQAFPTQLFLKHCPRGPEGTYLGDRHLTSRIACEGMVAFESYIGAILRDHSARECLTLPNAVSISQERHCKALSVYLREKKVDWQQALRDILPELPTAFREDLLVHYVSDPWIPKEALELLKKSIADDQNVSLTDVDAMLHSRTGRLDRWGVPRPIARIVRGALSVLGKR